MKPTEISESSPISKINRKSPVVRKSTIIKQPVQQIEEAEETISFKPKGLSLGLKYAIISAVAISVAVGLLVISAYSSIRQQIDEEINRAGTMLIRTVASFEVDYWEKASENLENNPLLRVVSDDVDIINLSIIKKRGAERTLLIDGRNTAIRLEREKILQVTADQIQITEGYYTSGIYQNVRTRNYTKPIKTKEGYDTGYEVSLFLSAQKIDEVKKRLFKAFLLPAFLAIIIGGLIGFWMATYVTSPLKSLMTDMEKVSQGRLEHQSYIKSKDEVGVLAAAFNRMTQRLKVAHELELASKAIEHELNIAHEIQANLLPKKIPSIAGYDVHAFYRACKEVGGDYYDIIPVDDENIGFIVADVSGKGIPGSMVMTMTRSLIRMEAVHNLSTADTLSKVNRVLSADVRRGMFVTALYFILNIKNHTILVSSAGHNPLIIWRHTKKTCELINPNGIALGFDRGPVFERTIREQLVQLFPGDRIVAYTDGVIEAMNSRQEEFGMDRFYKLIGQTANYDSKQFINTTIQVIDNFQNPDQQHDDITLISVRFTG